MIRHFEGWGRRNTTYFACFAAYAIGLIPMLGIGFHSFLDAIVYSITFTVSIFTGILAATGMVLHEFPEGIITYVLLLRGGGSPGHSFVLAFLAAGVSTPRKYSPVALGAGIMVALGDHGRHRLVAIKEGAPGPPPPVTRRL